MTTDSKLLLLCLVNKERPKYIDYDVFVEKIQRPWINARSHGPDQVFSENPQRVKKRLWKFIVESYFKKRDITLKVITFYAMNNVKILDAKETPEKK